MRLLRSLSCHPRGDTHAAGAVWLAAGIAFLGVAFFAGQEAFTGVGFAFIGLGLASTMRGRGGR